ncbi:hypothetical protein Ae201684P_002512 [Aphanomyces euteiches]|uniref:Uncharacterized protein n=1 Tax=Aphanomyces euteiches TaxID=100861 RepID=A0A6G0X2E7_9STRA|nr:hypothetical protein Ae201684_009238 [Aphanomyces euteiches]KAH9070142.1 hypothetical protein Ae201684P_002512 [Aphanomyces euteiches]KAH9133166.1 hypothetical protein AeRB84_020720 [Aphanomyces euteiches]
MSWIKNKMRAAATIVAQAAEAVAPSLSISMSLYKTPVEEFHHRWSTVSLFLDALAADDLTEAQQRSKLSDSNTRDNLAKLVKLLYAEEDALDRHDHTSIDSRPCMEYMLEHNVLQTLCAKAAVDIPNGLMVLVLIFLSDLFRDSKINYPILPTRGVYRSVCELIQAAMVREVEDNMVQKCLLHCLHALWIKLKGDPVQTEFFFMRIYKTTTDNTSPSAMAAALSPSKISELVLFTGLLPHMYREGKLGQKCREALVIAAGMHEPGLSRFILHMTPFCNYAVTGVIQAFDALPKTIGVKNEKTFRSVDPEAIGLELNVLATRLRFCSTLAMVGTYQVESSITLEILSQFHTRFLQGPLLEALLDPSEAAARTGVNYTGTILDMLVGCGGSPDANPMLHLTLSFLLHHHHSHIKSASNVPVVTPDHELAPLTSPSSKIRLLSELLHRMNSLSASLSVATIDLFAAMLDLDTPVVDSVLVSPPSEAAANADIPWFAARFPHSFLSVVTSDATLWHAIKSQSNTLDAIAHTDLMPRVLSLLTYVASAEQRACNDKTKQLLDGSSDTDDSDGDEAQPFSTAWKVSVPSMTDVPALVVQQGAPLASLFESILLDRLDRWLDNSFEENVALSGLVVRLADRAPHLVFDWTNAAEKSVRSVLEEVHNQAFARIQRMPQGWTRLAEVKARLMASNAATDELESMESQENLLVGYVVLEEMLQELVAALIARETVETLPVKPEGSYLASKPTKDDLWDEDTLAQAEESTKPTDELDSLLDSAAIQLQSIVGPP